MRSHSGQTIQTLGFESADRKYGLDPAEALGPVAGAAWLPEPGPKAAQGPLTGTWTEETNPNGYYQGSTYHGAIQLLADPTGHRMTGRWVGFGRDFDVNSGPWTLELLTSDTSPQATARYDMPPEPEQP